MKIINYLIKLLYGISYGIFLGVIVAIISEYFCEDLLFLHPTYTTLCSIIKIACLLTANVFCLKTYKWLLDII
jgi:hypothetical protein